MFKKKNKVKKQVDKAIKSLLNDRKAMKSMAIMTGIMMKLNSEEAMTLMGYEKGVVERNARFNERLRCYDEFRQALDYCKKRYKTDFKQLEEKLNEITKKRKIWKDDI